MAEPVSHMGYLGEIDKTAKFPGCVSCIELHVCVLPSKSLVIQGDVDNLGVYAEGASAHRATRMRMVTLSLHGRLAPTTN